jgi:hypothetical protein
MKLRIHLLTATTAVLLSAGPGMAQSQDQAGYADLIGKQVSYGDKALRDRGYRLVDSSEADAGGQKVTYAYWWHAGNRECIGAALKNGVYASIMSARASRCTEETNPALKKSADPAPTDQQKVDQQKVDQQKVDQQRVDQQKVSQQRVSQQKVGYADLIGKQVLDGDRGLKERGYSLAETATEGGNTHAYWWHDENRECIDVTLKKGTYSSIKPSGNLNCRKPEEIAQPEKAQVEPEPVRVPTGLEDLIDKPSSSGERELKARGFRQVGFDEKNEAKDLAWFYNDQTRACIRVKIKNGQYKNIVSDTNPNCR